MANFVTLGAFLHILLQYIGISKTGNTLDKSKKNNFYYKVIPYIRKIIPIDISYLSFILFRAYHGCES